MARGLIQSARRGHRKQGVCESVDVLLKELGSCFADLHKHLNPLSRLVLHPSVERSRYRLQHERDELLERRTLRCAFEREQKVSERLQRRDAHGGFARLQRASEDLLEHGVFLLEVRSERAGEFGQDLECCLVQWPVRRARRVEHKGQELGPRAIAHSLAAKDADHVGHLAADGAVGLDLDGREQLALEGGEHARREPLQQLDVLLDAWH
mmetsp:Transcript_39373/g.97245  ORF Transcript_39373/g.97245 Transcript_39373/m.97245 type:complete len:210 (-) Transcript_39373:277-906(-)